MKQNRWFTIVWVIVGLAVIAAGVGTYLWARSATRGLAGLAARIPKYSSAPLVHFAQGSRIEFGGSAIATLDSVRVLSNSSQPGDTIFVIEAEWVDSDAKRQFDNDTLAVVVVHDLLNTRAPTIAEMVPKAEAAGKRIGIVRVNHRKVIPLMRKGTGQDFP